ncbi:hypothetical protein EYC80_004369 [Monilinia laxa]|uniref:Peptidase M20 dimerisation domain-containing protein n=1 Tax=Monilinia laxa TaxID=61186 RepID=A0A5N6KMZ1_MONLA|nr:hypothetical protein EYC80_004369 [Monilinia laxa]
MDIPTLVKTYAAAVNVKYLADMYGNLRQGSKLPDGIGAQNAAKTYLEQFTGSKVQSDIGGAGFIGILENSHGPTVLLRAVMYLAGESPQADASGEMECSSAEQDELHVSCIQMTCMLFAATSLWGMQSLWKGTLVILFQPSVNQGAGARAMIDDGLYDPTRHACPIPDVILGQRVMPFSAGTVGTRSGAFGPGLDTYRVTVYGKGGHASQPHMTTDPMAMAASVIVRLQNITSKKLDLHDSAVVTVDSVVAGTMEDIIADQAVLKLNIRYFDSSARTDAVNLMQITLQEVQQGWNASKEPLVELIRSLPPLINDSAVTQRISASFDATFDEHHVKFCAPWGGNRRF